LNDFTIASPQNKATEATSADGINFNSMNLSVRDVSIKEPIVPEETQESTVSVKGIDKADAQDLCD